MGRRSFIAQEEVHTEHKRKTLSHHPHSQEQPNDPTLQDLTHEAPGKGPSGSFHPQILQPRVAQQTPRTQVLVGIVALWHCGIGLTSALPSLSMTDSPSRESWMWEVRPWPAHTIPCCRAWTDLLGPSIRMLTVGWMCDRS